MSAPDGEGDEGLHLVVLVDQSGSMLGDGKMQSVNAALEESLPHLNALAGRSSIRVDILSFATDPILHQSFRLPDDRVAIEPIRIVRRGVTETGAAIAAASQLLNDSSRVGVVVLISDGRATDVAQPTFEQALNELHGSPDPPRTLALGLGRDVDTEAMLAFAKAEADMCTDAMQMVGRLRRILAEVETGSG